MKAVVMVRLEIEIGEGAGDVEAEAFRAVDYALDGGALQDAINDYGEDCFTIEVTSATSEKAVR